MNNVKKMFLTRLPLLPFTIYWFACNFNTAISGLVLVSDSDLSGLASSGLFDFKFASSMVQHNDNQLFQPLFGSKCAKKTKVIRVFINNFSYISFNKE